MRLELPFRPSRVRVMSGLSSRMCSQGQRASSGGRLILHNLQVRCIPAAQLYLSPVMTVRASTPHVHATAAPHRSSGMPGSATRPHQQGVHESTVILA